MGENHERDDSHADEHWTQSVVSWGQFLLALAVALVGMAGLVVSDRISTERRFTVIEERMSRVMSYITEDMAQGAARRAFTDARLEAIQKQLAQIQQDLTRHQAYSDALDDLKSHNGGVRMPRQ